MATVGHIKSPHSLLIVVGRMSAILHITLFRIPLLVQIDFVFNLTAVERSVDCAKKYSSIAQIPLVLIMIASIFLFLSYQLLIFRKNQILHKWIVLKLSN
jgi:hypothetical protein